MVQTLGQIYSNAALPQKLVFLAFAGAALASLALAVSRLGNRQKPVRPSAFLSEMRVACPLVGVLSAALNGLHMMQTTVSLQVAPTVRMLAPGFMEMAALVGSGALAGLVAVILTWAVEAGSERRALRT